MQEQLVVAVGLLKLPRFLSWVVSLHTPILIQLGLAFTFVHFNFTLTPLSTFCAYNQTFKH